MAKVTALIGSQGQRQSCLTAALFPRRQVGLIGGEESTGVCKVSSLSHRWRTVVAALGHFLGHPVSPNNLAIVFYW